MGRALLDGVRDLPGVTIRSLYDRYPDFAFDVAAEQTALREATAIVWQCPFYWYGVPALLQHWFEKVLTRGFAYGPDGDALSGKPLLWVTTTGTPASAYQNDGVHAHAFSAFVNAVEQTARFCGMEWQEPIVVHAAHAIDQDATQAFVTTYRQRLEELA
jgi:glutathione-regulated potassium-efflux system ancillary protein KefF